MEVLKKYKITQSFETQKTKLIEIHLISNIPEITPKQTKQSITDW